MSRRADGRSTARSRCSSPAMRKGPSINGTRKVLAWMKEQGERPDHCLVGEPTNAKRIGESIKIGRRGSLNGRLKVAGTQGHVAYPHLANNPIKGLVKILARALRLAARLRQRAFLAVESRSDERRCRQSHGERDPGLRRGEVQCPLQRPALGRDAEGAAQRTGHARAHRHGPHASPSTSIRRAIPSSPSPGRSMRC